MHGHLEIMEFGIIFFINDLKNKMASIKCHLIILDLII